MPEREAREGHPTQLELDVIRTFGWQVIALEETMYQRFLQLSARSSLMTGDDFKKLLLTMESKGFLVSTNMHGKRAFRRLLVNGDIGVSVSPKVPLDEMRLVVGSLKAREKKKKERRMRPRKMTAKVISASQSFSEQLVDELEKCCRGSSNIQRKAAVHMHIENMLEALTESESNLFDYVREEIPECLDCVGKLLQSNGPDFMMLTLRLAEPQVRRYRI
ncbi:MAG: hypothetical protein ACW98Y_08700 [Candidatus Thorarchaeota archaeon]